MSDISCHNIHTTPYSHQNHVGVEFLSTSPCFAICFELSLPHCPEEMHRAKRFKNRQWEFYAYEENNAMGWTDL